MTLCCEIANCSVDTLRIQACFDVCRGLVSRIFRLPGSVLSSSEPLGSGTSLKGIVLGRIGEDRYELCRDSAWLARRSNA